MNKAFLTAVKTLTASLPNNSGFLYPSPRIRNEISQQYINPGNVHTQREIERCRILHSRQISSSIKGFRMFMRMLVRASRSFIARQKVLLPDHKVSIVYTKAPISGSTESYFEDDLEGTPVKKWCVLYYEMEGMII